MSKMYICDSFNHEVVSESLMWTDDSMNNHECAASVNPRTPLCRSVSSFHLTLFAKLDNHLILVFDFDLKYGNATGLFGLFICSAGSIYYICCPVKITCR